MKANEYHYRKKFMMRFELAVRNCGKTAIDLAKEAETSCCNISNYRYGTALPNVYNAMRLCKALGVSADWLLGLSDDGGPEK